MAVVSAFGRRGKDATQFPLTLASYAVRAVRSGRRVCGQEPARDVMASVAQQRHGFCVGKLLDVSTESDNPRAESVAGDTRSSVPNQVPFRCNSRQGPARIAAATGG